MYDKPDFKIQKKEWSRKRSYSGNLPKWKFKNNERSMVADELIILKWSGKDFEGHYSILVVKEKLNVTMYIQALSGISAVPKANVTVPILHTAT